LKILADEGVDKAIVDRLRLDGNQVMYVAEMAPSISDDAVLDIANKESALLITSDKDFGELIFLQRRTAQGVLLLRLAGLSNLRKAEIVSLTVKEHANELIQSFTVVSPGMIRIRSKLQ